VRFIPSIAKGPIKKTCSCVLLVGFWSLMCPALAVALWRYQRDQAAACNKDDAMV